MLNILLVTARQGTFHEFAEKLSSDPEVRLDLAASGTEALDRVRGKHPHLVVIDSELPEFDPFGLVRKIIGIDALVNTALIGSISDGDFQTRSEGLGVLCRLRPEQGGKDAETLLRKLRAVL